MSKKQFFVPYDVKGNMLESSHTYYPNVAIPPGEYLTSYWQPNDPFQAKMTFLRYAFGRSAVTMYMTDDQGHEYPMIFRYFAELIHIMEKGSVVGWWKAIKRGSTYGLVLVDNRDIPTGT